MKYSWNFYFQPRDTHALLKISSTIVVYICIAFSPATSGNLLQWKQYEYAQNIFLMYMNELTQNLDSDDILGDISVLKRKNRVEFFAGAS